MMKPKKPSRTKPAAAVAVLAAPISEIAPAPRAPNLAWERTKAGPKVLYIAGVSLFCLFVVVCILTAHLFQHAVRTAGQNMQEITLWRLVEAREPWQALQAKKRNDDERYASLARMLKEATDGYDVGVARQKEFERVTIEAGQRLNQRLVQLGATQADITSIVGGDVFRRVGRYTDKLNALSAIDQQGKGLLEQYQAALAEELRVVKENSVKNAGLKSLQQDVADAQKLAAQSTVSFANFLDGLGLKDSQAKGAFGDYLNQLNSLSSYSVFGLAKLPTMAPDLLTLLLVLAMGTLGGTLHLAKLFVENDPDLTASYYFYRPILGAIMALVMFVVVRSGLFVIADAGQQNGGAMLSPFFISFMAIVSGLLAEKAIATIQDRGVKWFATTSQEEVRRYAVHVQAEMEKQNKSRESLAATGLLTEDDIKALFEGKTAVSMEVQRLVSFALGKPIRELFSDIGPAA